jgi:dienelactone hydrolase
MRIVRFLLTGVLVVLLLAVGAIAVQWFFNPLAPAVVMSDPLPTGRRVSDDGLLANYFPGKGAGPHAGILMLGGSEGGLSSGVMRMALDLQARGYGVLHVSYFAAPGQSARLERIPLETFDRGIAWLKAQPDIDPSRLAVIGGSKGAEAALIVAARHPELRAAIAGMPSSVAWQGMDWNILKHIVMPPDGSWSIGGHAIPYVHYAKSFKGTLVEFYTDSLMQFPDNGEAVIRIEQSHAAVLLICGKKDSLWPSCLMADQVKARAEKMNGPPVTVLSYDDAGHAVFGIPVAKTDPHYKQLASLGGSADGNNAARSDSWPKVVAFLAEALR